MTRKWWTLLTVCLGMLMLLLDITIVNVALPSIAHDLGATFSDLQWTIDAYAVSLAALMLVSGSLGDLLGHRSVFAAGLVVFSVSSLLCGVAPDPLFLNICRAVQGIGGAAMFATSLALIAQEFQGPERGTALGIWGATAGASVAVGPLIGGALTSGISWRWVFFVNVPIGVLTLWFLLAKVGETRRRHVRPDWLGAIAFSGALFALVFALIRGNPDGWGSTKVVVAFVAGGVLLALFVVIERLLQEPMLDLGLFRRPAFLGASLAAIALSASAFSLLLYITLYLQNVLGYSPFEAGLRFLPLTLLVLLVAPIAGRLTEQVPVRLLLGAGLTLVAAGLGLMTLVTPSSGWTVLISGFIVAGAGSGLTNPPLVSAAIGTVPEAKAGIGSGVNNTARQVGVAAGIAALGAIFQSRVQSVLSDQLAQAASPDRAHAMRIAFVAGFDRILWIAVAIALAGAVLAVVLVRRRDFETGAGEPRHRVVVVGGGFAGINAVKGLRGADVDVTLVDRRNFHLFQPLTYQVATGALSPGEIAYPLRALFARARNVRVLMAEATGFDLAAREVRLAPVDGVPAPRSVTYDTLIVAAGSHYSYFGHDEWSGVAPEVKSLESALAVRARILRAFEASEVEHDREARRAGLTFVVVGAGPTGVEMAGQIGEMARTTLRRDFRAIDPGEARILLVEAADRVLPGFPPSLSAKAARSLEKVGVTPMVERTVVDVDGDGVTIQAPFGAGERVPARTVIWAAGVRASRLGGALAPDVDAAGRTPVETDLTLAGHPEVIVAGDMARIFTAAGEEVALPGLAPVAIQQGHYAARLVRNRIRGRRTRPFRYRDKGNLATIGRARAVADLHVLRIGGPFAWVAWLVVHLWYLIGFENRLLVVIRWSISSVTRGRGARLITRVRTT